MKNYSIWSDLKNDIKCNKVNKNMSTDILIVGGGITGISILYQLKKENIKTILVEANKCGYGVTSKSTAKITYLQEKIYMNIRKYNKKTADTYLKSQIDAVNEMKNVILSNNIDCDFNKVNSYVFSVNKKGAKKLNKEYDFLVNSVKVKKTKDLDKNIKLALEVSDTYVFHPLKFINYWKEKYQDLIYEDSRLISFKKINGYYLCKVNNYIIKAKKLVIASHYPYFLIPFFVPFKSHIEESFLGAKKVNNYNNVSAINVDKPSISYRYHSDKLNNYFIYLENSYISSNIKSFNANFNNLENRFSFDYLWTNNDIITNDYIPWIGTLDKDNSLFLATGYNTWGFTNATLAGVIIKDIILGNFNPYIKLMNPKRSINLSKIIQ